MAEALDRNKELIFEARKLCKSFGPSIALDNVDNRDVEVLVLTASIRDNIIAAAFDKVASAGGFISPNSKKKYVKEQIDFPGIKCASMNQNVQYLSGGDKQKVVFGKGVGRGCDILILDCPTRGVDVGVKAAMYDLIYV